MPFLDCQIVYTKFRLTDVFTHKNATDFFDP